MHYTSTIHVYCHTQGNTKFATSSLIPNSSTFVLIFKGNAGEDAAVENAISPTLTIFFKNINGFNLVVAHNYKSISNC